MRYFLFSIITFLLFILPSDAQSWIQEGSTLYGTIVGDQQGRSVSMSTDGSTIAFSSPSDDSNGTDTGKTSVYTNVAGTWVQKGTDIAGIGYGFGNAISISGDGNTLAIGTAFAFRPGIGTNSGRVDLYRFDGTDWVSLGTLWGAAGAKFGSAVSISADGNSVAVGAELHFYSSCQMGRAFVYDYSGAGTTWTEVTGGIGISYCGSRHGRAISLSADGNFVAVGAYYAAGTNAGRTRIYSRAIGWYQMGSDIVGEASNDRSGIAVSISDDGQRVAIGAYLNDGAGSDAGQVRVYQFNGAAWTKIGNDIDGESAGNRLGFSVDFTGDGNTLIAGGYLNSTGGTDAGYVKVLEYDGTDWIQKGTNIYGTATDEQLGYAVAISDTGDKIVVGALNGQNPTMEAVGYVKSYSFLLPCQASVPANYAVEMTTTTTASFTWDAAPDASYYQVKYRLKGTTAWFTSGTANTQRNVPNLTPKKYYQYKVRTQCVDGSWSDFTPIGLFYTSTCDVPTGVASVYLDNTRMRIRWDNDPNEIKAKVRYREVGTSTWYTQNSTPGNNYIYINGLTPNATYQYRVRSNCNGNDWSAYTSSYTHDLSSSLRLGEEESRLIATKIYPNPARDVLNIEFETQNGEEINITIVNSLGKIVQNINNSYDEGMQRESIDISQLAKGYYFMTIRSENRIETKKFLRVE